MLLHLDYRDSRPIYVQIMDALRQQIASGVLLPEEKLPSVRELGLLRQFDDSARNLLLRGYTRQELIKRLEQEENHA